MKEQQICTFDDMLQKINGSSILSELAGLTNKTLVDISETIKITRSGCTKTIVTKKSIICKSLSQGMQASSLNFTISATKKNKIVDIVFTEIFESLQKTLQSNFQTCTDPKTDKNTFLDIIATIDEHYQNIARELETLKHTYRKYMKDISKRNILAFQSSDFVNKVFCSLPELETYFEEFHYEILTLEEAEKIQQAFGLVEQLFDIDSVIRQKKKPSKKKNKKKKNNKNKGIEKTDSTGTPSESCSFLSHPGLSDYGEVVDFLKNLTVAQKRDPCFARESWLTQLSHNYLK